MNVMVADMSENLNTTRPGIQIAITIFPLVMAALMIPGGKLSTPRPVGQLDTRASYAGAGPSAAVFCHDRQIVRTLQVWHVAARPTILEESSSHG